ncbi:hypothetical protein [Micromonospora sp. NPDC005806]|uniref:hypothetical protein n=1 Tax=Micromonospora sp. NPDC005806 TaxID=3364234 RepID=UPI003695A8D6
MPIEIHEVEIINDPPAPPEKAPARPGKAPAAATGDQLRAWHRELAERAARRRAD